MKLRQQIIDIFRQNGQPAPVEDLAEILGLSIEELKRALDASDRLGDLGNLRIEDAELLIEFYGENTLFTEDVIENVRGYRAVRSKLDEIEEKAKKK